MLDSITEIKNLCELLDIENRQYVLAAAQALKFAQQKETKRKRSRKEDNHERTTNI